MTNYKTELKELVTRARKFETAYEIEFKITYVLSGYAIQERGFDNFIEVELYMDGELRDDYTDTTDLDRGGSKARTWKLAQDVKSYLSGLGFNVTLDRRVDR